MRRGGKLLVLALLVCLPACGGLQDLLGPTDCSVEGQNEFVLDTMKDIYLWYRELPNLDPKNYTSPEDFLEALRYQPQDSSFSFISGKEEDTAFYSESQFVGVGLSYTQTGPEEVRFTQVFPDSPASDAGIARGDYMLSVNGRSVGELLRGDGISAAFGASEIGVKVDLEWRNMRGQVYRATLVKRAVTIPTVSLTRTYDVGRRRVGYIFFRNFVNPSNAALDTAFRQLADEGATDLVLDLRYNGGGLVSVARHLGSLIGGERTNGEVFAKYAHNDKNTYRDSTERFDNPSQALDLPRLIVITTDGSASASEAVINGLRPFIPVTLIGTKTYGKPVGQYGFDFCEKVLYPVSFKVTNARGEGDYFGGMPVDCAAGDDIDRQLGDPGEASLAEALSFAASGRCSAHAAVAGQTLARARDEIRFRDRRDGWRQLVNAY